MLYSNVGEEGAYDAEIAYDDDVATDAVIGYVDPVVSPPPDGAHDELTAHDAVIGYVDPVANPPKEGAQDAEIALLLVNGYVDPVWGENPPTEGAHWATPPFTVSTQPVVYPVAKICPGLTTAPEEKDGTPAVTFWIVYGPPLVGMFQ